MREDICQLSSVDSEDLSDSDCCLSDWDDDYDDDRFPDEPYDDDRLPGGWRRSSPGSHEAARRVKIDNILYEDAPGSGGAGPDFDSELASGGGEAGEPVLAWTTQLLLAETRTSTAGIRPPPVIRLESVPTPVVVATEGAQQSPDRCRWPRARASQRRFRRRRASTQGWDDPSSEESGCSAASSSGDSLCSAASSVQLDQLFNLQAGGVGNGGSNGAWSNGLGSTELDSPVGPGPGRCWRGGGGNYCGNYWKPGDGGAQQPGCYGPNLGHSCRLGNPWTKDGSSPQAGRPGGLLRHGVRPLELSRRGIGVGIDSWDAGSGGSGRSSDSRVGPGTLSPHSSEGRSRLITGLERCRRIFHAESPVAAFGNGREEEFGGGGWFGR